jgi:hypothetical protein
VTGFEDVAADRDRVRTGETAALADHLDAAPLHQLAERVRDAADHRLLAINQCRPVENGLADGDVMGLGALDLVERMRRGDQHLFSARNRDWDRCRRAGPVRASRP